MKKLALLICAFPLLAACTNTDLVPEGTLPEHAGDAVKRNIAAQVVNPQAPNGDEAISMNGERAAAAQNRYVSGQVTPPANASSGGSSNSGAGAGVGATAR